MNREDNGLELTAPSAESVGRLDRALDGLLHFRDDMLDPIRPLLDGEAFFPLAEAFDAYMTGLSTEARPVAAKRRAFAGFRRRAARHRLTERERRHLDAAWRLLTGDLTGTARDLAGISQRFPQDVLALAVGHQVDFLLGDAVTLRDRIGAVLPTWPRDDPRYPSLLGMYAFGLEESGHWDYAEELGTEAADLDAEAVWAIHAVAHVHEVRARFDRGAGWLTARRRAWDTANRLRGHLSWHKGLYLLEAGDIEAVLLLYDRTLRPGVERNAALELVNGSSLLWRLHLEGADVGERFLPQARAWSPLVREAWCAFNDMHAVMCHVGSGDLGAAAALIADREAYVRDTPAGLDNVAVTAELGLPVARAFLAFGRGAHDEVLELLYPLRRDLRRCGGSHAQRDVIHQTLIESAVRAGHLDAARVLIGERLAIRPDSPFTWRRHARAALADGDPERAARARRRAEDLAARLGSTSATGEGIG
ncbi:tetratricopeptide repeat protein [Actinoallomurus vinaceus]|uniref:Tetratricopeptide repeat protein 38 n=1 Tax=Actinoallomurus vinaceus TaxID=1080074 RepID=A0ABP8UIK3_9ACTN